MPANSRWDLIQRLKGEALKQSTAVTEPTFKELHFAEQLFNKNQLNCDKQFS